MMLIYNHNSYGTMIEEEVKKVQVNYMMLLSYVFKLLKHLRKKIVLDNLTLNLLSHLMSQAILNILLLTGSLLTEIQNFLI